MIAGALVFSVIVSQGWSGRIVCGIIEKGGSATSGTAGECKRGGDLAQRGPCSAILEVCGVGIVEGFCTTSRAVLRSRIFLA